MPSRIMMWTIASALAGSVSAGSPPPFAVGETLTYDAKMGPLSVGSATASVARLDTERGHQVYVFTMSGAGGPPGLRSEYRLESWTALEPFTSLRFHRNVVLAGRARDERFIIVPDSLRYREEGSAQAWVAPPQPMDELALLYYLRTLSLSPGDSRSLRGYFRNGYNPLLLHVVGRETVTLGRGTSVTCVHLRITAAGTGADIWLTDDARRLPAQLDVPLSFGRVRLVLR